MKPTKQWFCLKSMAAKCATKARVKALYFIHRPYWSMEESIQALFSTYRYISPVLFSSTSLMKTGHIEKSCHMIQTLFSVIFNFVLRIVMSLLLLLLFLHVVIFIKKNKLAYLWRVELGDHLLGRRIFVYYLYQYYSDRIVSGVCSH